MDNKKIHYKPKKGGGQHMLVNQSDFHKLLRVI